MKKFFAAAKYALAGVAVLAAAYFFVGSGVFLKERRDISFGVTFSSVMAKQLGLDSRAAFDAITGDLGVKKIRLPVYWSEVEPQEGQFHFSDYDYFIKKSEEREILLILVVGRKLPRWPECHIPAWSRNLSEQEFEDAVLNQIRAVVEHYSRSPAVAMWQIENEHFHVFGADCASGKIKAESVDREIKLVRSLDSRPIMLTDAGKAGTWLTSLRRADIVGVTMYYQVWSKVRGVVWSTFGPGLFWLKREIIEALYPGKRIIVAELQAEPFGPTLLPDYDLTAQKLLMNPSRFRETIRRARKAGFDEYYLWGAEWWYWLKSRHKDPAMWEEARRLFGGSLSLR